MVIDERVKKIMDLYFIYTIITYLLKSYYLFKKKKKLIFGTNVKIRVMIMSILVYQLKLNFIT